MDDRKTRDLSGTAAFFAQTLGWRFEEDWRKATKVATGVHLIGGVSDLANPVSGHVPVRRPGRLAGVGVSSGSSGVTARPPGWRSAQRKPMPRAMDMP